MAQPHANDGLDTWRLAVVLSGLLVALPVGGLVGALWLTAVLVVLHRTRTRREALRRYSTIGPPAETIPRRRR